MERLAYLNNAGDWLIGGDRLQFQQMTEEFSSELKQLSACCQPPKIILAEREPIRFLAGFIAACSANCPVFLCNPNWAKQEWLQVFDLVQPDVIWGIDNNDIPHPTPHTPQRQMLQRGEPPQRTGSPTPHTPHPIPHTPHSLIMIPTGGSSGKIKFAIHTWETLMASVRGFTEYFCLNQVNSFCVLPLYHVSGLMQFMRSFTTGGKLAIVPFKEIESSQIYNIEIADFFISLVPTQLQSLLQNPDLTQWLSQFKTVLLGGAPAWNELLEKARYYQIRLAPTYGMTETASGIAILKPDDFLNSKLNSGKILPHANVMIHNNVGETIEANQIGNIRIQAKSLALGYYTSNTSDSISAQNQDYILVDDLGFFDEQGYLNIVGRNSEKIITGGENVYPTEIESAIKATQMVADVCVVGIPDQHWGEAVTAVYIPANSSTLEIQNQLQEKLSKFKIPKHWIPVQTLPRNSQGKINRQQLLQIAEEYLHF